MLVESQKIDTLVFLEGVSARFSSSKTIAVGRW